MYISSYFYQLGNSPKLTRMTDHLIISWQDMLLGLNHRPLNSLDEGDHPHSSHHYQSDIYPTVFTSSSLNQVPLIQCLFDSQPLMSYEFQEPNQLFTSRLPSQISRASSLSCHSSSSNRSHLNPHPQLSVADSDCHSPTPLHQSYLTTSIDFIRSLTSPKNSLLGFPSREARSQSISSDQNSHWKMAASLNNPDGTFEHTQWAEQTSDWKMTKFGLEREHERSGSEEVNVQGSRHDSDQCRSSFDLSGLGDYLDTNHIEFQSFQRRTPTWANDSRSTDDSSPFDNTASVFGLGAFPVENSLSDQFVSTSTHEGPVMAEFPLPPKLGDKNFNTTAFKRPRAQRSETQVYETGTTLGPATASKKAKKSTPRSTRTGNNGGRCRRLAPANRECPHCGDKFTRNDRLNYHIDSIHENKERKYKCIECAKAFRQRCDLQRHMRHVHKFSTKQH